MKFIKTLGKPPIISKKSMEYTFKLTKKNGKTTLGSTKETLGLDRSWPGPVIMEPREGGSIGGVLCCVGRDWE